MGANCCAVASEEQGVLVEIAKEVPKECGIDIFACTINKQAIPLEEDRSMTELFKGAAGSRRGGVADESVDQDRLRNFVRPVYEKDQKTRFAIAGVLKCDAKMAVLFSHLDGDELQEVIDAFQVLSFTEGQTLIKQGDAGDRLYICGSGRVNVFVRRPGQPNSSRGDKVTTLGAGALFGELALMYQAPRAATVVVESDSCTCWALDREPFKMLLAQTGQPTLEMYDGFLSELELLKSLNHFELSKLSGALESMLYDAGEEILTPGEAGQKFYIVEDGTCSAFIDGTELQQYGTGGYFRNIGDQVKMVNVRATGEGCSVLVGSKETFQSLPGPTQECLRNEEMQQCYAWTS